MGTDIHLILEVKHGDKWVCVDTFTGHYSRFSPNTGEYTAPIAESRNYFRFALLAGVRGDGPEPKGLPDDASDTTRYFADMRGYGGYSHSYLPLDKAIEIFVATDKLNDLPKDATEYPATFYFNCDENYALRKEARIVFWFDG